MGGEGQIESQRGGERHLFCPENKKHGRKVNFAATWWRRVDSNHRSETQQIYSLQKTLYFRLVLDADIIFDIPRLSFERDFIFCWLRRSV